jgi:sialic acid synthase
MPEIRSNGFAVGDGHPAFVVAEIGQNHNGDVELAKKLIELAAIPVFDKFNQRMLLGVNAIKLTKRDMSCELTQEAYDKEYASPHAFGRTYGEHREKLELSDAQHTELGAYAHTKGLAVIETLCAPSCISLLKTMKVDFLKVASRDLTNVPLLDALAETGLPIILSTGMVSYTETDEAMETLARKHSGPVAILHCLSEYPAQYENINLNNIPEMIRRYPGHVVGYSDHSIGIVVPVAAVVMGASIIEKHVTLSRSMKGTDHAGALEGEGLWRMVRDIRNVEASLGGVEKRVPDSVSTAKRKLERSLAVRAAVNAGAAVSEDNLIMLSPGGGLGWRDRAKVAGRRAARDIPAMSLVHEEDVKKG